MIKDPTRKRSFSLMTSGLLTSGLLLSVLLGGCSSPSPQVEACKNNLRAVIDMGSGSTKMTLAEVEKCSANAGSSTPTSTSPSARLVRIIDDKSSEAVALEAGKNAKGEIPQALQEAALQAIQRLQKQARAKALELKTDSVEFAYVGTHAYRSASNLGEFRTFLARQNIDMVPLTQDEEALAGVSAVKRMPVAKACTPLLVWDVGGGSAQFSFEQSGVSSSVGIPVGAEAFKTELMKAQKNGKKAIRKPKTTCKSTEATPNPMGSKNYVRLLATARAFANKQMDQLPLQSSCAVGIGGVHRKAIAEQIEKQWEGIRSCACAGQKPEEACAPTPGIYAKKELVCLTQFLSDKSDCDAEIKSPYSATSVSNLYMVLAFMEKFGIDKIHTAAVNMGHSLVVDDQRLNFKAGSGL